MCQLPSNEENNVLPYSLPVPDLTSPQKKQTARYKFWELKDRYHCAALGTCLTLNELRQIAQKAKISDIDSYSDYELHVSFIHILDKKCYVSTLVNKFLDKKFKRDIRQFSKTKGESDRIQLWYKAIETGEIAGAFWALLTHPSTTENTLFQVYGKVHMLSHISGASLRIDMKEFYQLKTRNQDLEAQLKSDNAVTHKKLNERDLKIHSLTEELREIKREKKELELIKQELEDIKKKPIIKNLEDQLNKLSLEHQQVKNGIQLTENSLEEWKQRARLEEKETQRLKLQIAELNHEKLILENSLSKLLVEPEDEINNCASCPNTNPDLCGRCVLYVGGRGGQYSHFRKLVEQQNGKFVHHDGGLEDGHQKLASIVSKADVILCPLDCVSHTAMNAVKRHCKNNTKQLVFIPHASLSAFAKGLNDVTSNHPT